jgi:hypothetical protein
VSAGALTSLCRPRRRAAADDGSYEHVAHDPSTPRTPFHPEAGRHRGSVITYHTGGRHGEARGLVLGLGRESRCHTHKEAAPPVGICPRLAVQI